MSEDEEVFRLDEEKAFREAFKRYKQEYSLKNCDVRIKGTCIYVKCNGIGTTCTGQKGIQCTYVNGPHAGQQEVIPGDCLIEEYR